MMAILTKVIVVVGVIVVGVFNVHFEPQDFVAPCGDSVIKAHLVTMLMILILMMSKKKLRVGTL